VRVQPETLGESRQSIILRGIVRPPARDILAPAVRRNRRTEPPERLQATGYRLQRSGSGSAACRLKPEA
jgi:hypothetical protein